MILLALLAVVSIALAAAGVALDARLQVALAIVLPAAAGLLFVFGFVRRVLTWANAPVPFRIPVTCGQQGSFSWLKPNRLDNPSTTLAVIGRMALEVLLFRSLFRNVKAEVTSSRLVLRDSAGLWLAALLFHYSLLLIVLRHLRFVLQPVPAVVSALAAADSFFQMGVPAVYATDVLVLGALGFLLFRRLRQPYLRHVSLFSDYFLLFVLLGVATTGMLMRHLVRVDTVAAKELAMSLVTLAPPRIAAPLHPLLFAHLSLVCVLVGCLPFTKLVHMAGVFLSPTRNLANSNRAKRHVNPWNYPVKVHTYAEWEAEYRDKLIAAGLPVEERADA